MKVIVQIPCYNEEQTLPAVLKDIPKKIKGVDSVEVLIIDDGSTDRTVEIAKKLGVHHIVRHPHRGLARSFHVGVLAALEAGADIVVNTDGDNQYPGNRIADLVQPIVEGRADMVIADRQVQQIQHFSAGKKLMQRLGTKILNMAAGTDVPDAPSGFRAYSRSAIMQLNIVTKFSYAMETIIQAGNKGLTIETIKIETNPKTRESRLFKSSWEHVHKSGTAIVRGFIMYRPVVVFTTIGVILLALGVIPFLRFLFLVWFANEEGARHIQSLLAGSVLVIGSFVMFALGVIADLIRINRTLIEDMLEQTKRHRFDKRQ